MTSTADTPMVYDVDDATGEIVYRPMNAAELKQRDIDAKAAIEEHRSAKQAEIQGALAASDSMLVKAHLEDEDARATAAIKKYRAELRDLHASAETAADPATITLPEPPSPKEA